jgi:large subunit ribosomal protein L25
MFIVEAKKRDLGQKLNSLRKAGEVPAVFYGAGEVTTPISIELSKFKKIWQQAHESSVVKISIPNHPEISALVHEVQLDPVTGEVVHVDFLVVRMDKKVKLHAPLEFTGISGAIKNNLGMLVKTLHQIEIEALPKDLPAKIMVDISKLDNLGSQVLVSDLELPEGVSAVTKGSEIVVIIVQQKAEKEGVSTEPVDLSKIEVEKKGKKEEKEGEASKS